MKDCEPPETSITASVCPCVGRSAPMDSGIQSICAKRARRGCSMKESACAAVALGRDPRAWQKPLHPASALQRSTVVACKIAQAVLASVESPPGM